MNNRELFLYANGKKNSSDLSKTKETLKALIDRTITSIDIPQGITNIGSQSFNQCRDLASVTIPNSVTNIGSYAFCNCNGLTSIVIPHGVKSIQTNSFYGCYSAVNLVLPNTITIVASTAFIGCTGFVDVTLEDGFNANGLDLSVSTLYSADTLVAMINALADRTGQTAYTLTLGSTNLAKLTNEQIAIATQKNWTLA